MASGEVVPLVEARDESQFGGKAVQLGAADHAGLPVPPGLALSAEFVEALVSGKPATVAAFEKALGALTGPFAIRSSGIGEDSAGASFAGQHTTKLNVRTAAQLAEALAAVWQSRHSPGALAYRRKLGLNDAPKMGVIVQQLVNSDVAGVLFTRNPVTGADERLIEATWGLGEAVVQGLVVPDLYRVSRTGEVLERIVGHKPLAIRAGVDGSTVSEPVAPELAGGPCLDDADLAALQCLARQCEEHFEGPSDLEWALADGSLYLLQHRRITRMAE